MDFELVSGTFIHHIEYFHVQNEITYCKLAMQRKLQVQVLKDVK